MTSTTPPTAAPTRFAVWIDAVGGFLICLGDELRIGQAKPGLRSPRDQDVEVPVLADLSRRHARVVRHGERCFVDPLQSTSRDGSPLERPTLLGDGDQLTLGRDVRLAFRQPNALSPTASLRLISPHRTQPLFDAVLLMGQTCVFGPRPSCHVVCPDWTRELVLFRQGDELGCRTDGDFAIDGAICRDRGRLTTSSRVVGDDFCLSLENVDRCPQPPHR